MFKIRIQGNTDDITVAIDCGVCMAESDTKSQQERGWIIRKEVKWIRYTGYKVVSKKKKVSGGHRHLRGTVNKTQWTRTKMVCLLIRGL